ncbi:alpha/beta fold hydrolase [Rhodococcus sp. NPDC058521]|uniref:alpha/beta hydrolase n=1 Tax=Rhodococcus sp. NPDC058521 TaxID=3346536 RepID=UPI00364B10CD
MRTTTADFAATPDGSAFYRAYDRVLDKWPVDVTRLDLASEFGTTRVNVCGQVDAPSVVLLPGAGATSTVWFANVAALANHYRVYAVDLIGDVGRSVANGTPVRTVDDLMSWLNTVTAAVDLKEFSLVGHSYGAMIALAYALREPDNVRSLALLDPNSCFARMRTSYLLRAAPLLLRPTAKRERNFIRWETDGQHVDEDWLDLLAYGAAHYPKSKTVVPQRPKRNAVEQMSLDTTVILAGDSKVHDSARVAANIGPIPRIHTVLVGGATHHTMPMVPVEALNAALIDALSEQ